MVEAAGVEPPTRLDYQQVSRKPIAQDCQNRSKSPVQVQIRYSSAVAIDVKIFRAAFEMNGINSRSSGGLRHRSAVACFAREIS
jgi:hypothetical protein